MKRRVKFLIKAVIIGSIVIAGFGSAVLYLWNWLMPEIFGLKAISFWQALGLMGLSWILFRGGFLGRPQGRRPGWRLHREWRKISPEQRAQIKAAMKERCSGNGGPWGKHVSQQHVEPSLHPPVG